MAYNLKYYHQYNDRGDHVNRVEILGKDFGGAAQLITTSTGDPIITRHAGDKDDRKVIKGKEMQFSFYCFPGDVDKYDEIFESDYKDYKIRYYEDSQLKFEGWLMPENLSREFFTDKYIINLSATDGLAKLKNVEFRDSDDAIIEGVIPILEVIKYALAKLELELDFRIQLGTYENALMASTECALKEIGVETRRFILENKPMFCSQVIEDCLKPFSCTLKQQDGYWQITNKQEGDSMQFVFDWSILTQQSRTATSKIVDLAGYFYESAELSKIGPLREFGIIARTRDLGSDQTGLDLTDWDNDWTITFDDYTVIDGTVELDSGSNYAGDYIEPDTDFHIPYTYPENENDYVTVTFAYYVETVFSAHPNPLMLIQLKHPGSYYASPVIISIIPDRWRFVDLKIHPLMKIVTQGDHNVRFTFDHTQSSGSGNYLFRIRDVKISVITNAAGDPDVDVTYSIDEYHRQTTGRNLEIEEVETLFADGRTTTETGALLHNLTTLTTAWNTYGGSEGITLLDIWARNELNNRYNYKNYLKIVIHDKESTIDMDNILSIEGRYYTFVSYHRNHKKTIVTGDIEELLLTKNSYSTISTHELTSVEGEDISGSSNANVFVGVHNYLLEIQGGNPNEYYHLTAAEHVELHGWLDNVVLSDAGGIDMDGTLQVDTITEHTADAGIDVEGVHLEDGGITLGTGPAVDTIETTLTDDDTHLPTSGAVYDAVGGVSTYWSRTGTVLSPVNAGDDIEIDGGVLTVNTINEYGAGVGVTIEGILNKDSNLSSVNSIEIIHDNTGSPTPLKVQYSVTTEGIPGDLPAYLTQLLVRNNASNYSNYVSYIAGTASFIRIAFGDSDSYGSGMIEYNNNVDEMKFRVAGGTWGLQLTTTGVEANVINELTPAAGVTIDSLLIKDQNIGTITEYQGTAYLTSLRLRADGNINTYSFVYTNTANLGWHDYTYRYGGTIASPAAAPTDAAIRHLRGYVNDGTTNREILRYTLKIDGSVATDNIAGEFQWWLRASGVAAPTSLKMQLTENGLGIDDITELTASAGVTIEGIKIEDSTFVTAAANMTFQDGTGGPYTLAQLYAGGTPSAHHTTHENGGADEINVAGLSGLLGDAQNALSHAANHENGGGDEISVLGLSGLLADGQTPLGHLASHHTGGSDLINHDSLTGFVSNEHINHISVSIGAGIGLSGGGDITASRTIDLDLSDLTTVTVLASGDYFGIYDASSSGTRNITYANLITALNSDLTVGSHTHGNITNAGAIGTTTNLPIITTTSGVLIASSFGTGANTFCQGNDARLSDARTPTAHASSHHTGGSDLVNHDSLTGFVAAEHYSHTAISMGTAATSGLNGGGTIAATRALVLAVDRLTAVTTLQTTDYFPFYDASGAGTRRITYANILTALNSDLSFGSSDITMDGSTANGVITYGGVDNIDVEAKLTFDGDTLALAQTTAGTNATLNLTHSDNINAGSNVALNMNVTGGGTTAIYSYSDAATGTIGGVDKAGASVLYAGSDSTSLSMITADDIPIYLSRNGTVRLEITSIGAQITGNLGIGVAPDATYDLKVQGTSYFVGSIGIAGATSTDSHFKAYNDTNERYAGSFFHDGNSVDRYGIKIQCGEDDQAQGGTQAMYVRFFDGDGQSEGNIVVDAGTVQFAQVSDARRKTNIEDVSLDITKTLSDIRVREFDMLKKDGKTAVGHQIGWIAQEVIEAYSPMASYDKDTDLFGIKPAVIVPLLHRGWQLHEDRFETQQQKINRLERRVKYLENKLKKS